MRQKNIIAMAVAGACAWPLMAAAAPPSSISPGHWEVVTPLSVNETASWFTDNRSHLAGWTAPAAGVQTAAAPVEVVTPLSVDESAPWLTAEQKRLTRPTARTTLASLPNPRTPSSPNESGVDRYAEDAADYAAHVAAVEQARIAAATPYAVEPVARGPLDSEIDRLLLGASETPQAPREPESVATITPALVDSRQSAASAELATPEAAGAEPGAAREPDAARTGETAMPMEQTAISPTTVATAPAMAPKGAGTANVETANVTAASVLSPEGAATADVETANALAAAPSAPAADAPAAGTEPATGATSADVQPEKEVSVAM
jgi:hypothetical protein